jgi:hypothetical protein
MSSRSASTSPAADRHDHGRGDGFIWSITLREALFLALIAALIFLGKSFLRVPVHVPGHSGIVWIALMVIGRGLVNRRGAGVLMGLIAGALVTFGAPGKEGLFEWTKYVAAGAILDLLVWTVGNDLETWWKAALVGAGAHLAKLVTATLMAWVLGLPLDIVVIGLGLTATTHVVFGALGGALGALVLTQLRRVPQFRTLGERP